MNTIRFNYFGLYNVLFFFIKRMAICRKRLCYQMFHAEIELQKRKHTFHDKMQRSALWSQGLPSESRRHLTERCDCWHMLLRSFLHTLLTERPCEIFDAEFWMWQGKKYVWKDRLYSPEKNVFLLTILSRFGRQSVRQRCTIWQRS